MTWKPDVLKPERENVWRNKNGRNKCRKRGTEREIDKERERIRELTT